MRATADCRGRGISRNISAEESAAAGYMTQLMQEKFTQALFQGIKRFVREESVTMVRRPDR
jgi:hypothetical protein